MDADILTDEELHAYVQYECGNKAYFNLKDNRYHEIGEKIKLSTLHQKRYEDAKKTYLEIAQLDKSNKRPSYWLIAAAVVFILMVSTIGYYGLNIDMINDQKVVVLGNDEIKHWTDHYGTNTQLDNRAFYPNRGSGLDVLSPPLNAQISGDVKFLLELKNKQLLTLKVRDIKNRVIHATTINENGYTWTIPEDGIYYWSIENEKESIYWGKFFGLQGK